MSHKYLSALEDLVRKQVQFLAGQQRQGTEENKLGAAPEVRIIGHDLGNSLTPILGFCDLIYRMFPDIARDYWELGQIKLATTSILDTLKYLGGSSVVEGDASRLATTLERELTVLQEFDLPLHPNDQANRYVQTVNLHAKELAHLFDEVLGIETDLFSFAQYALLLRQKYVISQASQTREIDTIRVDIPDELVTNISYRNVLENLVGNAMKYAFGERTENRVITLQATRDDGAQVYRVSVRDNGEGINTQTLYNKAVTNGVIGEGRYSDQQLCDLVFEEGLSTGDSQTRQGHGLSQGLGLANVKKIIEERGGEIGVVSSTQGTTFSFTIPYANLVSQNYEA